MLASSRIAIRAPPPRFPRTKPKTTNSLRNTRVQARFQSTSPTSPQQPSANSTTHFIAGVAGGISVFTLGYTWYHFSGAKTLIQTSNQAQSYFKSAFKKTQEAATSSNSSDTIDYLRETAHSYTRLIPGASTYIDSAFDDVSKIREKHGDQVDQILNDAKSELKDVTNKPANLERVSEVWEILSNALRRIGGLAGDSAEDILNNHPYLKDKVGPKITSFKHMGEQYGPEAKQVVDDTWREIQDALKSGFSMQTVSKVQDVLQKKTEELQQYGEKAL